MQQMKNTIFFLFYISISNLYSQDNGLKNYYKTLNYTSVYKVDLDINKWEFQNYHNTSILFDINENGSGRVIVYYLTKNVFYVDRNYKTSYSDGSGTYFFILNNGAVLRLGITPDNYTSAFSLVLKDNTTITFSNK